MTYIPVPPATSGHAKALTLRIDEAIAEYRRENPRASDADVAEALRRVQTRTDSARKPTPVLAALGLGLVALGGLLAFYLLQR